MKKDSRYVQMWICFDRDNQRGPDDDGSLSGIVKDLVDGSNVTFPPSRYSSLAILTVYRVQHTTYLPRRQNICIDIANIKANIRRI